MARMKRQWIVRNGKTQLVDVTETQIGQFGDRDAAVGCAGFHRNEFDDTVVRRSNAYGWIALGVKYGRVVQEVA